MSSISIDYCVDKILTAAATTTTNKRLKITSSLSKATSSTSKSDGTTSESSDEDDAEPAECDGDSIPLTLVKSHALNCPICSNCLTHPVFQCEDGHIACASCCTKLSNKCWTCSKPIGYKHCLAMEMVIKSLKIPCQYKSIGCKEKVVFTKKKLHENSCIYAPCSCPVCSFNCLSKNMYAHFEEMHLTSAKHFHFDSRFVINLEKSMKNVILQEKTKGTVFVVNYSTNSLGNDAVNVIRIVSERPKKRFWCDMRISDGVDSELRLQSYVANFPNCSADSHLKKCLLIPSDFIGSCNQIKLSIFIRRH